MPEKTTATEKGPEPQAQRPPLSWWRRAWDRLRSRFARQITIAALVIGAIVASGHYIGGIVGWWHAYELTFGGGEKHASADKATAGRQAHRSIVALPLVNESEDRTADWFVDALTADLTTELGRLPDTLVIGRETAVHYKGKNADPRAVSRELGVRYVLGGSARRDGEQVRLNLSMVDGESSAQLWAQTFDIPRAELAASFDEIARMVARSLSVEMYRAAGERRASLKSDQVDADDLAMQGWATYSRGYSPENVKEAVRLFEEAVAKDPGSIRAWGGVAVVTAMGASTGWMPDRDSAIRRSEVATEKLQTLNSDHFYALLSRANIASVKGDYENQLLLATTMSERFPNHAPSHGSRGWALLHLGRFEECFEPTARAVKLSPRDPLAGVWHWQTATCHFMRREYPQALDAARRAQQANPRLVLPPLVLAASLVHVGRKDEARKVVGDYLARSPGYEAAHVERIMRGQAPAYVEGRTRLMASLREAGLP